MVVAYPRHWSARRHATVEGLAAEDAAARVRVGDHERTAGPQRPGQFADRSSWIGEVARCERHHSKVELRIAERQPLDVAELESNVGQAAAGHDEHVLGTVDTDRRASVFRQELCLASGTTGGVERVEARAGEFAQDRVRDALFGFDRVRAVVGGRNWSAFTSASRYQLGSRPSPTIPARY